MGRGRAGRRPVREAARFEPTDPNAYAWGEYEPLMAAAKARGWSVLMTISGPVPKWATQAKLDNLTRPSATAFAAFAQAVGRKYGDQVNLWAIWNEPNQPQFLRPQFAQGGKAVSPAIYRSLYLAGVRGLRKAGQGDDTILLGETSPRGTPRVVAPLRFLRGVLCLNAKYKRVGKCAPLSAGGYAHHAYTTKQGPSFKPPPDDVTIGALSRLTTALDRARSAGALTSRLPLHLTEFGIQSTPDTTSGRVARQAGRVPRDRRADRLRQPARRVVLAVPAARQRPDRAQASTAASSPGCASPTASRSRRCPPSACRSPSAAPARRSSIWGLVRPGDRRDDARPSRTPNKGSSRFLPLRTVQTNALGYFQFSAAYKAGRRWNVTWQGQSGSPVGSYTR